MKNKIVKSLAISLTALMTLTSVNLPVFAQSETNTAQSVAQDTETSKSFLLEKNGSAAEKRAELNFVFRQSDYQPTGILFWPEQSYTVTVSGLDQNDPLPSIGFSQNRERIGDNIVNKVKLTGEIDANGSVTTDIKAPSDTYPGALYLMNPYTSNQQKGNPTITISRTDGQALSWYPMYKKGESLDVFKEQLREYKKLIDSGEYPQYVDLVSDRTIISTSFDAAYDIYVEGKDSDGKAISLVPDDVLNTADQALEYEYAYAGLKDTEYPKQRQQIRAIGMNKPFFATNEFVGFDYGDPEYYSYEILKPNFIKGWGTLHEFGHVIENKSIKLLESTNNLYVLDAIKKFSPGSTSRLASEKRYDRLFSTYSSQKNNVSFWLYDFEKDNSNYNLEELSIWDRLVVMDQLNQYFRHVDGSEFWTEITKTSRETPLKGVPVNDALNKIVVLAAKRYQVDIRPFFRVLNLDERFVYFKPEYNQFLTGEALTLVQELDGLPKINPLARYIDETYEGNETKALETTAKAVVSKIETKGTSNKLTIELKDGNVANLLGYEIYRTNAGNKLNVDTDFIGYTKASKNGTVTFMDTLNVADYRFDYYAKPIGKNLEYALISEKTTSTGKPGVEGTIKVTDIAYDQFVDVLSVKGKGYSSTNGANQTFMQLVINGNIYDTTDQNEVVNPNTGKKDKNFIHFYPQADGSWEMRIVGFDKLNLGDNLEIKANFMEISKVPTEVAGETQDVHKNIASSEDILRNIGDISVDGSSSSLIKSISVEGIKGAVDEKFDPLNFNYTDDSKYIKQSLSEKAPEKTILDEPTGEVVIKLDPADLHTTYKVNVTSYRDVVNETTGKVETIKDPTFEAKDGMFRADFNRADTYKWEVEVVLTAKDDKQQSYKFEVYSPSEDAYLDNAVIRNNPPKDDGDAVDQSDFYEITGWDYTKDYIYVTSKESINTSEAQNKPVILKAVLKNGSKASWEVYHKSKETGDIDRNIVFTDEKVGTTNLVTSSFKEDNSVYFAVKAQDGVTIKEYNIIFRLPDDAKQTANLRDIEISGQGEKNVGYIKNYIELDKTSITPQLFQKFYTYDGAYTIAPTTADSNIPDDEAVKLTVRPIVDYYTKYQPKGEAPTVTWDFWKIDVSKPEGSSIKLDSTLAQAAVEYSKEDSKDIKIRPNELKKLTTSELNTVNGAISLTSEKYNLRMTITSADGKTVKRYLFFFEPSAKSPLESTDNFNGNINIYNRDLYDPNNKELSDIGGKLTQDQLYYIYEANDPLQPVTFRPSVYEGKGEVYEIIDGKEQKAIFFNDEYMIDENASGFIYRIDAPDGSRTYAYRFYKYRPTDSSLKSLTTNGYLVHLDDEGNPVEGFDPNVKEYYMLTNDLNNIQFNAETNDGAAKVLSTIDGRERKLVAGVQARTLAEVTENNPGTGKIKELEFNVTAQSDSTSTYSILVSDKFDFLNVSTSVSDTTELQAKVDAAKGLLDKGNFDDVLYNDLNSAYNNATKLLVNNYIAEDEYKIVNDLLVDLISRYSEILPNAYVNLYNQHVTTNNILKTPALLREKLAGQEFITDGNTLVFYAGNATDVTIPENITEIGAYAFSGCHELANVNLNNVTSIGYAAFEGCINLNTVTSLENVALANRSFWDTKITLPASKNWLYNNENVLIGSVTTSNDFVIPEGVKSIDAYAFHSLTNVDKVVIPYTVSNIGTKAFYGSATIKEAAFAGNKLTLDQVFSDGVTITNMDTIPSYKVTLDQKTISGTSPNFTLTGAGTYNVGDKVEISAPFNSDYIFAGWKYAETDAEYFSTSSTVQITVTGDTNLIAYYTEAPKYSLTLEYDVNGGNVTTDKEIIDNVINGIKYDERVMLVAIAKNGYKFDGWYTNGRLVSKDLAYGVSVLQDQTVEAKFVENTKYTVTFADTFDKVYGISVVEEGQSATAPEDPARPGYTFAGWDKDFTNVTGNMTVYPKWKKDVVTYQIKIEDGKLATGKTEGTFEYSQLVVVVANPAPRNKVFSHWEDTSGNIMSYDSVYSFAATSNITLKAVYADEKKQAPISVLTNTLVNKTTGKISFVAKAVVPEGYEKVECGVIILKNKELNGELTLNTVGHIKGKSSAQNQYGEYSLMTSFNQGDTFYARSYLTYRNLKTNELVTVYCTNTDYINTK